MNVLAFFTAVSGVCPSALPADRPGIGLRTRMATQSLGGAPQRLLVPPRLVLTLTRSGCTLGPRPSGRLRASAIRRARLTGSATDAPARCPPQTDQTEDRPWRSSILARQEAMYTAPLMSNGLTFERTTEHGT